MINHAWNQYKEYIESKGQYKYDKENDRWVPLDKREYDSLLKTSDEHRLEILKVKLREMLRIIGG